MFIRLSLTQSKNIQWSYFIFRLKARIQYEQDRQDKGQGNSAAYKHSLCFCLMITKKKDSCNNSFKIDVGRCNTEIFFLDRPLRRDYSGGDFINEKKKQTKVIV